MMSACLMGRRKNSEVGSKQPLNHARLADGHGKVGEVWAGSPRDQVGVAAAGRARRLCWRQEKHMVRRS